MKRREFIKSSCTICAVAATFGLATNLSSCSTVQVYKTSVNNNVITVPKTEFVDGAYLKVIRSNYSFHDILLVNKPETKPLALLMTCTHFNNALVVNNDGLNCNLHGSSFSLTGEVKNGPATKNLKTFLVTQDANNFYINTPQN